MALVPHHHNLLHRCFLVHALLLDEVARLVVRRLVRWHWKARLTCALNHHDWVLEDGGCELSFRATYVHPVLGFVLHDRVAPFSADWCRLWGETGEQAGVRASRGGRPILVPRAFWDDFFLVYKRHSQAARLLAAVDHHAVSFFQADPWVARFSAVWWLSMLIAAWVYGALACDNPEAGAFDRALYGLVQPLAYIMEITTFGSFHGIVCRAGIPALMLEDLLRSFQPLLEALVFIANATLCA